MAQLMQLRTWLVDTEPEIWRRLLVDPRLTLEQLHTVLQYAFGWENAHMHQFHEKDGTRYAIPSPMDDDFGEPAIDERKVQLRDAFNRKKKMIAYEYDFGDSWIHAVHFEKLVDSETVEYPVSTFVEKGKGVFSGKVRAAICIAGERNGPPEDCGGLPGFYRILELKQNATKSKASQDDEVADLLEWLGDWDAEFCQLGHINEMIGRVRVKKAFLNR